MDEVICKKMKEKFAVVFDMDGVILDTEGLVLKCWSAVADKYGIPDIKSTCMACLGLNAQAAVETFKNRYGQDFPYDDYKVEMRDLFLKERIPVKEGAEELLKKLKENQIPVALASSTRSEMVLRELDEVGLLKYFDKVICGDMVSHSKPHPEIFLKACEELGICPEQAFAVEDSFSGIRAAYAGGLRPVMVPDMVQPTEEIRDLTVKVCESLAEVKEYLFDK